MATLVCKNCGGSLALDAKTKRIVCENCGSTQPLHVEPGAGIYDAANGSERALATYQRALQAMELQTENGLQMAANMFAGISGTLDADMLAAQCREQITLLRREKTYQQALADMEDGRLPSLQRAQQAFASLGNYRDSATREEECRPLLEAAEREEAHRQEAIEAKQRREAVKKKRRIKAILLLVVLAIGLFVLGNHLLYSSSNIKITFTPDEEQYVTEKYNDYVFHYDITLKNEGFVDVQEVQGTVLFETEDGEVLIDTSFHIYNYDSAVVRAGKSSHYTWELTVESYDTALALYESDFEDIRVVVDITQITFADGKTKEY